MYLRTIGRKNKDGSIIEYYQLAHNERHPETRKPVAKVIHSFGRADELDRDELVRLCKSIARVCGVTVLDPFDDDYPSQQTVGLPETLKIIETRSMGCVLVIETLWERLGLKKLFNGIIKQNHQRMPYERALLAMVTNRLCAPESKLGAWDRWLETVYLPSCESLKLRHMYEAMDLLYDHAAEVEKTLFFEVANLFNLTVDLIFYDTTTASFSIDWEDEDPEADNLRKFGHSKEGTWTPQIDRKSVV